MIRAFPKQITSKIWKYSFIETMGTQSNYKEYFYLVIGTPDQFRQIYISLFGDSFKTQLKSNVWLRSISSLNCRGCEASTRLKVGIKLFVEVFFWWRRGPLSFRLALAGLACSTILASRTTASPALVSRWLFNPTATETLKNMPFKTLFYQKHDLRWGVVNFLINYCSLTPNSAR